MKFGVVGYGVVGQHMVADIRRAGQDVWVYDKFVSWDAYINNLPEDERKERINACDCAFICVPTPEGEDGHADISAVEEVFSWLDVDIAIIRSTVPPGTTWALAHQEGVKHIEEDGYDSIGAWWAEYDVPFCDIARDIVFVPEFIGEGVNAPYSNMKQPPFLIIGGEEVARWKAAAAFSNIYNSECEFVFMESVEAEIAKYAENYFLAMKVTWANELWNICAELGADYHMMMNGLTHDYRIGRSHTHVYEDRRGWSGKCLPKDTAALLAYVGEDIAPLLAAVRRINEDHKAKGVKA